MKRIFLLQGLMPVMLAMLILPVSGTFGQENSNIPLIKEVIEKSRNPGEKNWKDYRKTSYQYNHKDLEILKQISLMDDEGSVWQIDHQEFSKYNENGIRNWFHMINYDPYPNILNEREEFREYENGKVKHRKIYLNDHSDPQAIFRREYDVFYTYNHRGDLIEYRVQYLLGEVFGGGYGFRRYYDDLTNCRTGYVNYDVDALGNEILVDSAFIKKDSRCNTVEFSLFEYGFNSFSLIFQQQIEYDYDANGNVLKQVEYVRNRTYEKYEKIRESNFTYNNSGLLISYFQHNYMNGSESRKTLIYDSKDRLTRETLQNRNDSTSLWESDYELIKTYNEDDQLIKSESYLDWDTSTQEFNNYTITEHIYDSQGNIIQTITNNKVDQTISRQEQNRQFRCDGAIVFEETKLEEFNETFIKQSEEATQTSYFTLAPCENSEIVQPTFALYPNPAEQYFHIYNENPFGKSRLQIIKASGEMVKEINSDINNYFSVEVVTLEPGLYIVNIESEFGTYSKRFIKK